METAKALGNARTHAVVEAVPMPAKAFGSAPLYFKKAVDDASGEWSQHHAKRLIDTRVKVIASVIWEASFLHWIMIRMLPSCSSEVQSGRWLTFCRALAHGQLT